MFVTKIQLREAETALPPGEWAPPLVLDLDNSLLRTDLLHESTLLYLRGNPLRLFRLIGWLLLGIAHLKARLAQVVEPESATIPTNRALVDYARQARRSGRVVLAVTASNQSISERVCAHFDFIDTVIGSSPDRNLKGKAKARLLQSLFPNGFTYAGDSRADRHVWRAASAAIFVGRSSSLERWVETHCIVEAKLPEHASQRGVWQRALRLHQWAKNGLVFLPLLLSDHIARPASWLAAAIGFVALGAIASATYLINDLCDLSADRQHWRKRTRPIASGELPILTAGIAALGLMMLGAVLAAAAAGLPGLGMVFLYAGTSLSYTFWLKRVAMLDVTVLAGLFTMRLAYGAVLAGVWLTHWLAAFSMFLFWSLGLVKRATELERLAVRSDGKEAQLPGRGYVTRDLPIVTVLGGAAAVGATIVAALYLIESALPTKLYNYPAMLWAIPPVLLLWLSRIWLLCGRGALEDDPVAFALRDPPSIAMGGVICLFFAFARAPLWL